LLIPIKDDQPTVRTPHFTIGLIFINTAIFLFTKLQGLEGFQEVLFSFGFRPLLFLDGGMTYFVPSWLYLTPLSSMFLHGGWMHLIGNMLFLWIYGNNIEDYFGPTRFVLFYIFSGFVAVGLHTLFNLDSAVPLVGASGAIAGVMGAYYVLHPRAQITCLVFFFFITFITLSAKVVLGIWFVYQVLMSLMGGAMGGGTAWLAHVGGFLFGWGFLKLLLKIRSRGTGPSGGQQVYRMQW
jgi:membrane associated rhomboid family serine protease